MQTLTPVLAAVAVFVVACTKHVDITPDPSGSGGRAAGSGVGGTSHGTLGAGGGSTGSGSGAGACCSEPIQVAGPVKVVTADTDPAQLVTRAWAPTGLLVQGPFVLTDVHAPNGVNIILVDGMDCSGPSTPLIGANNPVVSGGLRMYVPAGKSLCNAAGNGNSVTIGGFRPY
jgi:hypothetical protein